MIEQYKEKIEKERLDLQPKRVKFLSTDGKTVIECDEGFYGLLEGERLARTITGPNARGYNFFGGKEHHYVGDKKTTHGTKPEVLSDAKVLGYILSEEKMPELMEEHLIKPFTDNADVPPTFFWATRLLAILKYCPELARQEDYPEFEIDTMSDPRRGGYTIMLSSVCNGYLCQAEGQGLISVSSPFLQPLIDEYGLDNVYKNELIEASTEVTITPKVKKTLIGEIDLGINFNGYPLGDSHDDITDIVSTYVLKAIPLAKREVKNRKYTVEVYVMEDDE